MFCEGTLLLRIPTRLLTGNRYDNLCLKFHQLCSDYFVILHKLTRSDSRRVPVKPIYLKNDRVQTRIQITISSTLLVRLQSCIVSWQSLLHPHLIIRRPVESSQKVRLCVGARILTSLGFSCLATQLYSRRSYLIFHCYLKYSNARLRINKAHCMQ